MLSSIKMKTSELGKKVFLDMTVIFGDLLTNLLEYLKKCLYFS